MKAVLALRYATATLLLACSVAQAQSFPNHPIKLLIPYPPGGSADMLARPISVELQKELGQPVILEYKAGAGGTIATSQLARAKPDGHTILMVLAAHAINPNLYKSLPYDTHSDFAPVSLVATLPLLVAAPNTTPADTIEELVSYARKNPGELTFASAGNGNTSHLAGEMFKSTTSIDMLHVPYKGSSPAVVALLAGDVSLMFDSISTSLPQVKAGRLKAIAVTSSERSALLPDVPTVKESGYPDFAVNGWYGILAPAGTPKTIVDRLNEAFTKASNVPSVTNLLNASGYSIVASTPEAFADHINNEINTWQRISKEAGIQPQ
ncbi:tripartite tricarboxylate transporter substrate binding protein [Alcaligenaceae bacterium]|nr:tripartite tricarboxylate transporter substrate binding protein [Alcaligenaceae bacterium]